MAKFNPYSVSQAKLKGNGSFAMDKAPLKNTQSASETEFDPGLAQ